MTLFYNVIYIKESTLAKDLITTGNYLSEGEQDYGWADTPRTCVNRIKSLQDAMSNGLPARRLAGAGGDSSNPRSELDKGIYHDPR